MIMVGLSLLGLGFVAVSETESAIAVNERNYVQAQAAAEMGAKTVIEWFQDAPWSKDRGILPQNDNAFKTKRTDGAAHDYYKPNPGDLLCDIPLKGDRTNKFFGADADHADVMIKYSAGGKAKTFLDALSSKIFYNDPTSLESTRISDIRIFAPPWPGAQPNGDKYFDSNASSNPRYGIATVRVTAQKIVNGQVRAERAVKAVIAETPFPTVDGAIETSGSLVGQGNFMVYWGKILSEKNMEVNRPAVGMPWFDAKNQIPFEYGYDSTQQRSPSTAYHVADVYGPGDLVNAPETCIAADADLAQFAYRCINGGTTGGGAPNCPDWSNAKTVGATIGDSGGITWRVEAGRPFRIDQSLATPDFYVQFPWLYQMMGKVIEDPWLHARARGTLVYGNNKTVPCSDTVNTHPCDYTQANSPSNPPTTIWGTNPVQTRYSNFFQNLTFTQTGDRPESIEAVFPTMDYDFWKAVAQSGSNDPGSGIYYFEYAGDGSTNDFKGPGGKVKTVFSWMNAALNPSGKPYNGLGPGFYFFDTQNQKNPQFNKGGTLTPDIDINSGTVDEPKFQIRGYVYLNAANFGSKGVGTLAVTDVYPMPGEPYRDVGYREVDKNTKKFVIGGSGTLPTGTFSVIGANNGQWDYEDVNDNQQFDVWTEDITRGGTVTVLGPDGNALPTPTWVPIPYYEGCTIPDNTQTPPVPGNCSEPHEPFLNFTYPPQGTPDGKVKVEWYDPNISAGSAPTYRKSKTRTGPNAVQPCDDKSKQSECTSNAYDKDGALVTLSPIAWGAIYNEGGYAGSGNADYYGAVLMRGSFNATGTPNVWFDECLARGCLETQLKMQRVMVTSMETDQSQ